MTERRQLQSPSLSVQAVELAARVAELRRAASVRDPHVGITGAVVELAGHAEALARIVADVASMAETALDLSVRAVDIASARTNQE